MQKTAKIISIIFHPLIIPVYGLILFFNTNTYLNFAIPSELKQAILLLVGISTFIIPTLITLLLLNKGFIKNLEMETTKERIIPYSFTFIFYVFTLFMLRKAPVPPLIFKFIIGAALSVLLAFIINFKWKISAHAIGVGGLIGALIFSSIILETNLILFVVFAFLASGLVISARLVLKSHTPIQVYAGFLLGVLCQFFAIYT